MFCRNYTLTSWSLFFRPIYNQIMFVLIYYSFYTGKIEEVALLKNVGKGWKCEQIFKHKQRERDYRRQKLRDAK